MEYDGEWGCTQFAEELCGLRRDRKATVAKLALLSGALAAFLGSRMVGAVRVVASLVGGMGVLLSDALVLV